MADVLVDVPDTEIPIFMRIGDGSEEQIGSISRPDEFPAFLREAADYAEAEQAKATNSEKEN